ncbi:MAG: ABC transporter permease [Nitrospiraceae bacterium]|nr:ABC transporter permease [Nitrospiraceae bacterium]
MSDTGDFRGEFRDMVRSFTLLQALLYRDISARYKKSLLGPAWAILQPLVLMVIFSMLRGIVKIPSDNIPYVIFSYSALVPWTFFSNAVNYCGPSILTNAAILKKMALWREVFPLAAVVTAVFDFVMSFAVLVGMMAWFRIPFSAHALWAVPLLLFMASALAFGIGMFVAALGSFKRDIIFAMPFIMQFWIFATPVMYPLSSVPARWRVLYLLNPMAGIVEGFRNVLIKGTPPGMGQLGLAAAVTLCVLALSWTVFRLLSQYFADVI